MNYRIIQIKRILMGMGNMRIEEEILDSHILSLFAHTNNFVYDLFNWNREPYPCPSITRIINDLPIFQI